MNFIAMALLLKDENTIANFLRENNRFNDMLARLEEAAPPEEGQMIQQIRTAQDEILTTVARHREPYPGWQGRRGDDVAAHKRLPAVSADRKAGQSGRQDRRGQDGYPPPDRHCRTPEGPDPHRVASWGPRSCWPCSWDS